ncbi:MAG: Smr/MutS family protein [Chitinophagales bacterium]|nr:Smr/MutS family protein [Chitinophagales bacterium]
MVDLKLLWIGDTVKIISSGRVGKFEGLNKEGKARIAVQEKVFLATANNLEKLEDEKPYEFDIDHFLEEEKQKEQKQKTPLKIKLNNLLDLHIDKLAPHMVNELPQRILEFQLAESEKFIKEAIRLNYPQITIIHGKGQGVLKEAITHQLGGFSQVRFTFTKNQGGAVEIWLI